MTRIGDTFARLQQERRKALVVYLTAGDPDTPTSVAAATAAIEGGADILEIGVPFSDPVADGPVIQQAMLRSLEGGGGFENTLSVVRAVRQLHSQIPIVVFGYLNPLMWYGLEQACAMIADAGADGILVVDAPLQEAGPIRDAVAKAGLDWVPLIAPTSPSERIESIAKEATGFIYVISMAGVTGGQMTSNAIDAIEPVLKTVAHVTDAPVCVGFGIRNAKDAQQAARVASGVVVGSSVVQALEKSGRPGDVQACVTELRKGVDAVQQSA